MYVAIFRATIRSLDDEYLALAQHLREIALSQFGCLGFHALSENGQEIALSYWPNEPSIQAWKNHPDHRRAQQLGKDRWYANYRVQIASITHEYQATPIDFSR